MICFGVDSNFGLLAFIISFEIEQFKHKPEFVLVLRQQSCVTAANHNLSTFIAKKYVEEAYRERHKLCPQHEHTNPDLPLEAC